MLRMREGVTIMGAALVIGFLSAIGWWGGNKVTAAIDGATAGPVSIQECIHRDEDMHEYEAQVVNVVDGDTIDVVVDLGFKILTAQRLRLSRVDTPERGQAAFDDAKQFVKTLIENKRVVVKTHKVSKWGYYLADVTIDGKDVSDSLIAAGLGKPYDGGKK